MGCDIHLRTEVRVEGAWRPADVTIPCWCVTHPPADGRECYSCKGSLVEYGYNDRNYDVFAILANVRNGYGFAGIATGDGFVTIADPRGLPDDLCAEYKRGASDWMFGDHSFSHVTLAELNACDWTRTVRKFGVVSAWEFKQCGGDGFAPRSYRGDVMGQRIRNVPVAAMAAFVERCEFGADGVPTRLDLNARVEAALTSAGLTRGEIDRLCATAWDARIDLYTRVSWIATYAERAGRFYSDFVPALRGLGDPENVRIVFGFDS